MSAPGEADPDLALAARALALGDGLLCQSVCLDLIDRSPAHAAAATSLLVQAVAAAPAGETLPGVEPATLLGRVEAPAERAFLEGLLAYRRARSLREEGVPDFVQRGWLERSRDHLDRAVGLAPDHREARAYRALLRRLLGAG